MHHAGYGYYRTSEGYWEGEVWAHYDEDHSCPGRWEVGIGDYEGTEWYTMGLVDFERFSGTILIAKGTFGPDAPEWPLSDLPFIYKANLKTMKWTLKGPGFMFRGELEGINY